MQQYGNLSWGVPWGSDVISQRSLESDNVVEEVCSSWMVTSVKTQLYYLVARRL